MKPRFEENMNMSLICRTGRSMDDMSNSFPQQKGFNDCAIFAANGIESESGGLAND